MVPFTLSRVFGTIDTYYTSEAVTVVSSEAFVDVVVQGGTIVLDGFDLELDAFSVSTGSVVQVKLVSSSEYGHTTYASIQIEDQSAYFSVTTDIDGALVYDYTNENLPLNFSASALHSGSVTWQPNKNPRLHILNGTAWQSSINLVNSKVPSNVQREYAFLADRWSNKVYRIDLSTNTVAQTITLPQPVAIGRIVVEDSELGGVYHYTVALQNGDIVRLDPLDNYAPNYVGKVDGNSVDLISDQETNSIWVIDTANRCTKFTFSKDDASSEKVVVTLPSGSAPSALMKVDSKIYVALFGRNAVAVVDTETLEITSVPCCDRPVALTASVSTLFVAGHNSELSRIQFADLYETKLGMDALTPTFIEYVDGMLLVSDHQQNQMMVLSINGVKTGSFNAAKPLAVMRQGSRTLLFTDVSNAPSRFGPGDNSPSEVEFIPRLGRDRGERVTSNSYRLSGVNLPTQVSVDPLSNSTVILNDMEIGVSAIAQPGDNIVIATTLPNRYETAVYTDVTVGDYTTPFITSTLDQNSIPNSIVFERVEAAEVNTQYDSNVVTISGMGDDTEASVFVENAILLLNGEISSSGVTVKNGDTVALRITSGDVGATTGVLRIGPIEATFFVQISDPIAESVLPFEFVSLDEQPIGSIVRSNTITVDWLVNAPMGVRLTNVYSASIVLNGELVGDEADLYNGDEVALEMEVTSGHFIDHVLTLFSDKDSVQWTAKTVPDLTPSMFALTTIRNGWLRQEYLSEEITVSGLTTDFAVDMSVQPEAPVIVNGERLNDKEQYSDNSFTFTVSNGDVVQFVGIPGPVYGMLRRYTISSGEMVTFFNVYARPVDGAYENPANYFLVQYDTEFSSTLRGTLGEASKSSEYLVQKTLRQLDSTEFEAKFVNTALGQIAPDFYTSNQQLGDVLYPELKHTHFNVSQGLSGETLHRRNVLGDSTTGISYQPVKVVADELVPVDVSTSHVLSNTLDGHVSEQIRRHDIGILEGSPYQTKKEIVDVSYPELHRVNVNLFEQLSALHNPRYVEHIDSLDALHNLRDVEHIDSLDALHNPRYLEHVDQLEAFRLEYPITWVDQSTEFDRRFRIQDVVGMSYSKSKSPYNAQVKAAFGNAFRSHKFGESMGFGRSSRSVSSTVEAEFERIYRTTWYSELLSFINMNHPVQYSDMLEFVRHVKESKSSRSLLFVQNERQARYADLMEYSKQVKLMWFAEKKELVRGATLYTKVQSYFEFMGAVNHTSSYQAPRQLEFQSHYSPIHVVPLEFQYQGQGGRILHRHEGFSADDIKVRRRFFDTLGFAKTNGVYLTRNGFTGAVPVPTSKATTAALQDVQFVTVDITRSLFAALDSGTLVRIPTSILQSLSAERTANKYEETKEPTVPEPTGAENMFTVGPSTVRSRSHVTINDSSVKPGFAPVVFETFEDKDRSALTPELMLYHNSAEDAYQGALDAGVEPERIQTHELYENCWVWAEVLDQPDLCEVVPDNSPDSGWIKGG